MPVLLVALFTAALLNAAPAEPREAPAYLLKFSLDESPSRIVQLMGPPTQTADFDVNYRVWQYQIAVEDKHDFSHTFCFRKSDGKLVSITRSFGEEQSSGSLFPSGSSTVHHWPDANKPQYSVIVRQLPGDRILIGMGISGPDQKTRQILLIRREALRFFLPWLVPPIVSSSVPGHRVE